MTSNLCTEQSRSISQGVRRAEHHEWTLRGARETNCLPDLAAAAQHRSKGKATTSGGSPQPALVLLLTSIVRSRGTVNPSDCTTEQAFTYTVTDRHSGIGQ